MTRIQDVSNNNGAAAVISADGLYCKVTEGVGFIDSTWPIFRRRAAALNIPVGGYLFAHPTGSPEAQADYFYNQLRPAAGDLIPALDLEVNGDTPLGYQEWGIRCAQQIAKRLAADGLHASDGSVPVLCYWPAWFINGHMDGRSMDAYPYWSSAYGPEATLARGWTGWDLWQYTDRDPATRCDMSTYLTSNPPIRLVKAAAAGPATKAAKPKTPRHVAAAAVAVATLAVGGHAVASNPKPAPKPTVHGVAAHPGPVKTKTPAPPVSAKPSPTSITVPTPSAKPVVKPPATVKPKPLTAAQKTLLQAQWYLHVPHTGHDNAATDKAFTVLLRKVHRSATEVKEFQLIKRTLGLPRFATNSTVSRAWAHLIRTTKGH